MKIAIITGASSGLGKEFTKAVYNMYPHLDQIWVIARRKDRLEELKENLGEKIRVMPFDITDGAAQNALANLLKEEKADVKLLINNAGYGKLGNFEDLSKEDNVGMIELNCCALTAVTSIVLPFMSENSEIINTCSIASFAPNTRLATYSSTKSFVMSLSRALRVELKKRRINVLAVCPGPMDTEFLSVANIPKGASKTFDTLPRVKPQTMAVKSLKASKKKKAVYTNLLLFKFFRVIAKLLPKSIVMKICGA